jgi:hypothetical protein
MTEKKWSSTAGPIQTKRVLTALGTLRARAFTTVERHGVIGVKEYTLDRLVLGFGTGHERTPGTDAILAIYNRLGETFNWSITRDNVKAIETAITAALSEVEPHVPVEDSRKTPEQDAEERHDRAAQAAANAQAEAIRQAERDTSWAPILAKAGRANALVVAELKRDTSDPMSDYSANTTERRVAIGVRHGKREDFRQIRTAAERFLRAIGEEATVSKLTEHRDNHSMGRGNYVSDHGWDGAGSGWTFTTWALPLHAYSSRHVLEDMMPALDSLASTMERATDGADPQITPSAMRDGYVEIRFAEKPDAGVLEALKGSGFRWALRSRCWYGPEARVPASLTPFLQITVKGNPTLVPSEHDDAAVTAESA